MNKTYSEDQIRNILKVHSSGAVISLVGKGYQTNSKNETVLDDEGRPKRIKYPVCPSGYNWSLPVWEKYCDDPTQPIFTDPSVKGYKKHPPHPAPTADDVCKWIDGGGFVGHFGRTSRIVYFDADQLTYEETIEFQQKMQPQATTRSLSNIEYGDSHKKHFAFRVPKEFGDNLANTAWYWNGKKAGEIRWENHVVMAEPTGEWADLHDAPDYERYEELIGLKASNLSEQKTSSLSKKPIKSKMDIMREKLANEAHSQTVWLDGERTEKFKACCVAARINGDWPPDHAIAIARRSHFDDEKIERIMEWAENKFPLGTNPKSQLHMIESKRLLSEDYIAECIEKQGIEVAINVMAGDVPCARHDSDNPVDWQRLDDAGFDDIRFDTQRVCNHIELKLDAVATRKQGKKVWEEIQTEPKFQKRDFNDKIKYLARKRKVNPFVDILDSLGPASERDHEILRNVFYDSFEVDPSLPREVVEYSGVHLFTSMAGRWMNPGCELRGFIVLEGDKKIGKTQWMYNVIWPELRQHVRTPSFIGGEEKHFLNKIRGAALCICDETPPQGRNPQETFKRRSTETHFQKEVKFVEYEQFFPATFTAIFATNSDSYMSSDKASQSRLHPAKFIGRGPLHPAVYFQRNRDSLMRAGRDNYVRDLHDISDTPPDIDAMLDVVRNEKVYKGSEMMLEVVEWILRHTLGYYLYEFGINVKYFKMVCEHLHGKREADNLKYIANTLEKHGFVKKRTYCGFPTYVLKTDDCNGVHKPPTNEAHKLRLEKNDFSKNLFNMSGAYDYDG